MTFPLGRNLEHDPRSKHHIHPLSTALPKNVYHTLNGPHLDQGNLGSCEGNTAAEFLNSAKAFRNRKAYNTREQVRSTLYLGETDAVRFYSAATTLDNDQIPGKYPPTDTGTSGVGIAKALQKFGAIASYNWTFTWTAFLAALQSQPVMLGTSWYESMFTTDSLGYVIPPKAGDQPAGGHAYLAYVLDYTHSRIGCTNHWMTSVGVPWGKTIGGHAGSFWMSFTLAQRLLINEQGDSLVPVLM